MRGGAAAGGVGAPLPPLRENALIEWSASRTGRGGRLSGIVPGLFVANKDGSSDSALLAAHGITAVANVGGGRARPDAAARYLRVHVADADDAALVQHFPTVCDFIAAELARGGTCAVHCRAGMHRSPTFAAAFLIAHRGLSAADAMRVVQEGRPIARPRDRQLRELGEWEALIAAQRPQQHQQGEEEGAAEHSGEE